MSTPEGIGIVSVERIDGTEVIIELSDGTCVVMTAEELLSNAKNRVPKLEKDSGT